MVSSVRVLCTHFALSTLMTRLLSYGAFFIVPLALFLSHNPQGDLDERPEVDGLCFGTAAETLGNPQSVVFEYS